MTTNSMCSHCKHTNINEFFSLSLVKGILLSSLAHPKSTRSIFCITPWNTLDVKTHITALYRYFTSKFYYSFFILNYVLHCIIPKLLCLFLSYIYKLGSTSMYHCFLRPRLSPWYYKESTFVLAKLTLSTLFGYLNISLALPETILLWRAILYWLYLFW